MYSHLNCCMGQQAMFRYAAGKYRLKILIIESLKERIENDQQQAMLRYAPGKIVVSNINYRKSEGDNVLSASIDASAILLL